MLGHLEDTSAWRIPEYTQKENTLTLTKKPDMYRDRVWYISRNAESCFVWSKDSPAPEWVKLGYKTINESVLMLHLSSWFDHVYSQTKQGDLSGERVKAWLGETSSHPLFTQFETLSSGWSYRVPNAQVWGFFFKKSSIQTAITILTLKRFLQHELCTIYIVIFYLFVNSTRHGNQTDYRQMCVRQKIYIRQMTIVCPLCSLSLHLAKSGSNM